jgi:hypothetical protein
MIHYPTFSDTIPAGDSMFDEKYAWSWLVESADPDHVMGDISLTDITGVGRPKCWQVC